MTGGKKEGQVELGEMALRSGLDERGDVLVWHQYPGKHYRGDKIGAGIFLAVLSFIFVMMWFQNGFPGPHCMTVQNPISGQSCSSSPGYSIGPYHRVPPSANCTTTHTQAEPVEYCEWRGTDIFEVVFFSLFFGFLIICLIFMSGHRARITFNRKTNCMLTNSSLFRIRTARDVLNLKDYDRITVYSEHSLTAGTRYTPPAPYIAYYAELRGTEAKPIELIHDSDSREETLGMCRHLADFMHLRLEEEPTRG